MGWVGLGVGGLGGWIELGGWRGVFWPCILACGLILRPVRGQLEASGLAGFSPWSVGEDRHRSMMLDVVYRGKQTKNGFTRRGPSPKSVRTDVGEATVYDYG